MNKIMWLGGQKPTPAIIEAVGGDWDVVGHHSRNKVYYFVRTTDRGMLFGCTSNDSLEYAKERYQLHKHMGYKDIKPLNTLLTKDPGRLP